MMYYIEDGKGGVKPIDDVMAWVSGIGNTQVADTVRGGIRISTIFLGIDYNFTGGPPTLYETMVFGGEMNKTQNRFATREVALRHHAHLVRWHEDRSWGWWTVRNFFTDTWHDLNRRDL